MAISFEQALAPREPVVLNHDPVKVEKAWWEMMAENEAEQETAAICAAYEEGLLS